jgi:uncharacterized protein (DUF2236 family)
VCRAEFADDETVSTRELPDSTDAGLFGPDSVTWRVHADPSMVLGGLRALFLQAVHPLAMAGVAQHSEYRTNPWGRLRRTAEFVGQTTYGTTAEAEALGARVRAVHRDLGGIEPETGLPYRVADPDLLRWVHVCEVESFLTTFRRSGGVLAAGDADRYYDEAQRAAVLVGCPDVPRSERDVEDYLHDMRSTLLVTPAARDAVRFIVNPPMPRWVTLATPAKIGWWSLGGLGFALLPRWARRLYSLPGLPTTDRGATVAARLLRTASFAIPLGLREGPALRAARARLAEVGKDGPGAAAGVT